MKTAPLSGDLKCAHAQRSLSKKVVERFCNEEVSLRLQFNLLDCSWIYGEAFMRWLSEMWRFVKVSLCCWFLPDTLRFFSFRINSSSGVISTGEALDHETFRSHLLIVQAEDKGAPQSLRTAVRVSINVTDVNDNAPKFFEGQPDLDTVENNLLCGTYNITVCSWPFPTLLLPTG